jgi:hypothetical protein
MTIHTVRSLFKILTAISVNIVNIYIRTEIILIGRAASTKYPLVHLLSSCLFPYVVGRTIHI